MPPVPVSNYCFFQSELCPYGASGHTKMKIREWANTSHVKLGKLKKVWRMRESFWRDYLALLEI